MDWWYECYCRKCSHTFTVRHFDVLREGKVQEVFQEIEEWFNGVDCPMCQEWDSVYMKFVASSQKNEEL